VILLTDDTVCIHNAAHVVYSDASEHGTRITHIDVTHETCMHAPADDLQRRPKAKAL
jgi:hypothetical protein